MNSHSSLGSSSHKCIIWLQKTWNLRTIFMVLLRWFYCCCFVAWQSLYPSVFRKELHTTLFTISSFMFYIKKIKVVQVCGNIVNDDIIFHFGWIISWMHYFLCSLEHICWTVTGSSRHNIHAWRLITVYFCLKLAHTFSLLFMLYTI